MNIYIHIYIYISCLLCAGHHRFVEGKAVTCRQKMCLQRLRPSALGDVSLRLQQVPLLYRGTSLIRKRPSP